MIDEEDGAPDRLRRRALDPDDRSILDEDRIRIVFLYQLLSVSVPIYTVFYNYN
jgi:hypothetical protein